MTTPDDRKGLCAAFGCPLPGSMSLSTLGDSKWFCACHFGKTPGSNDAITARLNGEALKVVANACRDIREFHGTDEWHVVKRGISNAFKRIDRPDLLPHKGDAGLIGWLARLERVLIDETREAGRQDRIPLTIPTAPVVGPTHIGGYNPYAGVDA